MSGGAKRGFTVFMELFRIISAFVLAAVTAYLLGSINFAIIITKAFLHKDIRDFGSGNAGMTNVLRTLGKGPAALTLTSAVSPEFILVTRLSDTAAVTSMPPSPTMTATGMDALT